MYSDNQSNNSVSGALVEVVFFLAIIGLLTIFGLGVYVGTLLGAI